MQFTGVPELDQQILLKTDLHNLNLICRTNTYFNALCSDDLFWKAKFIHDYGAAYLAYKSNARSFNHYYQMYYQTLQATQDLLNQLFMYVRQGQLQYDEVHAVELYSKNCNTQVLFEVFEGISNILVITAGQGTRTIRTRYPSAIQLLNLYLDACQTLPHKLRLSINGSLYERIDL